MNEAEKFINNLYGKGTIGFICDSCGRETNGCNIVNGMKFCAKCYQETFGKDNQQNEIQQLKEQLEALILEISKQKVEQHDLPDYCTRTGTDCTNLGKIEELQRQLAEKDIRIEELEGQFAYECECNKQLVELQKQLEKKQNTIDEINKEFVQAVHDWKVLCAEKDKEISKLQASCQQVKTQLAIQELEKIKNKCDGMYDLWLNSKYKENMYDNEDIAGAFEDISVFANDLIKKLKGE